MPSHKKHPIALAFQNPTASTSSKSTQAARRTMELRWRQQHSQSDFYPFSSQISTDPPKTLSLSIRQKQCGEQDGTGTGAVVWNAAHVLSVYLTKRFRGGDLDIFVGKRIVDLGTGTGLTGLVACALGASEVTFTDIGPVLDLTRENIASNLPNLLCSRQPVTSVVEYWWGSDTLPKSSFDIVLVADCILPKLYPMEPLVAAISYLLAPTGVCFVSYEHRVWFEVRMDKE